jgi:methanethiol oxidase
MSSGAIWWFRGLRSSRIYIFDTKPDPRAPKLVKTIEPDEIADKTGYTRPHTVHCGPGGIYVAALGDKDGKAPGGVFVMDHEGFEPLGRWEVDRGGDCSSIATLEDDRPDG